MPALARRRDLEAPEECWHVYYGDVRVGWIGIRAGVPNDVDQWGWSCGFYPGCHGTKPRRCSGRCSRVKFKGDRPLADPEAAARKLLDILRGSIAESGLRYTRIVLLADRAEWPCAVL